MATVKVAVTQLEPEWLNLQASVEKTCKYITEAAANGAKLVAFAEGRSHKYHSMELLLTNLSLHPRLSSLDLDSSYRPRPINPVHKKLPRYQFPRDEADPSLCRQKQNRRLPRFL